MNSAETTNKLHDLRLSGMAEAFNNISKNHSYDDYTFEEKMGKIVDCEWTKRQNGKLLRLIRSATLRYPDACMEAIEYRKDRELDHAQLTEFSTCGYIINSHNIILMGATGCGKTYVANALGMAACREHLRVKYIRLTDLFNDISVAVGEGSYIKEIKRYIKPDLLILDDFLLEKVDADQVGYLLDIIESRVKGSIIFCSQIKPDGWSLLLGEEEDAMLSEAVLDRIKNNSYVVEIKGDKSMRERHGLNTSERETELSTE